MGRTLPMSKSLRPFQFGEDVLNSPRTQILLRAWMVWRARAHRFADGKIGRKRVIDDEVDKIIRDIRKLQPQKDGLLGDVSAGTLLRGWAPDVFAIFAT